MCGICFSVRQRFAWRRRAAGQHLQPAGAHDAASAPSMPAVSGAARSDPPRRPTAHPFYVNPIPATTAPASSSSTAVASRRGVGGVVEEYAVSPCHAAAALLLHAVPLIGCRRRYVAPSPQALAAAPGSALFMAVLDNIRRRGPETFGATRRALEEVAVAVRRTKRPAVAGRAAEGRGARVRTDDGSGGDCADRDDPRERPTPTAAAEAEEGEGGGEGEGAEVLMMRTELQGVSAVLGLRGHETVHQPFEMEVETDLDDEDGDGRAPVNKSFLLWNGEIFNGSMCPPPWGSDTVVLASRLSQLEQECVPTSDTDPMNHFSLRARQEMFLTRCVQAFEEEVQGPYGFLFYANQLQLAVFGRDPLGRHSLLAHLAVTATPPAADGRAVSGREGRELDVELLISSVGVQHASRLGLGRGGTASETERKRPRGAVPSPSTDAEKDRGGSAPQPPPSAAAVEAGSGTAATPPTGGKGSGKKSRTESSARRGRGSCPPPDDDGGDEDNENEAGAAGGDDADADQRGCWLELPVSGLFALPLDQPLLRDPESFAAAAAASAQCVGDGGGGGGGCCGCSCSGEAVERRCGRHLLDSASGVLLHCPWRDRYHLVHPLLRAFTAVAEDREQLRRRRALEGAVDAPTAGESAPSSAAPPLPFALPSSWEPPKRPLLFSPGDTVPALPPLLAACVERHTPPPGADDDAVWSHWAATCYLHALSAAVLRRTDVASAGAEDSRDWASFSKALRRPLCVLFSGGIDCTVLAALAHNVLPLETPIELVNVAFGGSPEQAPDRIAALRSVEELVRLPQPEPHPDSLAAAASLGVAAAQEREWRLVLVDVPERGPAETERILDLVTPRHTVMDLDIGSALWYAARGAGRMQVLRHSDLVAGGGSGPAAAQAASPHHNNGLHPTAAPGAAGSTGVNGGAGDGGLLKGFHKLLRVADASSGPAPTPAPPPTGATTATATTAPAEAAVAAGTDAAAPADTDEARFGLLREVLVTEGRQGGGPERPVLLSTLGKEYGAFLQPHLAAYGYKKMGAFLNDASRAGVIRFAPSGPSKAVLLSREEDKARAAPLPSCRWLVTPQMRQAAQATGGLTAMEPPPGTFDTAYVSKAKVLLLGMGADETLGGYTRYRRCFTRQGMRGTRHELEKDFGRLWRRNLGRDDRVTMDSGREPRFPFLDEELLITLEKIVAERRRALVDAGAGAGAAPEEGGGNSDDGAEDEEAALLQMSIEPIVSFRLGPGHGDKRVLRSVAAIIGLGKVTRLQKRAIQFGSRIADRRVRGATEL